MSVNPRKVRKILVVHGVQYGKSEKLNQHNAVKALVESRLGSIPLKFKCELYRYEHINDKAQAKFKLLTNALVKTKVGEVVAKGAIDVIGDVVTNLLNDSVAAQIRAELKEKILKIYEAGHPCYIVAHSLGTIYSFDVLNELMNDPDLFDRQSRKTWPVQGMLSLGSPIGLPMFKGRGRTKVNNLGEGSKFFRWLNYWDKSDPVVSGKVFGKQFGGFEIAEKYQSDNPEQGWIIRDKAIDTGKVWMAAHCSYWENPQVGDDLVDMITN
jgi:hypothetical protein